MGSPGYRVGKLNGRKVVTWRENGKRRRYRLRPDLTPAEIDQELTQFIKTRERANVREAKTVGELFPFYVRDRELDGKSIEKQVHSWKALQPVFGLLSPDDIDKETCRGYRLRRQRAGRAVGTVWTELTVLRAALNWACKSKHVASVPHIWLPEQPRPRERHLTHRQAEDLLAATPTAHVRLFILLALSTAGRASALLELIWNRVNFERGQVDLRTAENNKIKRRAIVPMNATLRAALSEAKTSAVTPFVIEWAGLRVHSVKRAFARTVAKCGWDDVTPHTLRHTAAVWMAEAGIAMTVIAQYLGHSDSRITERIYARYSPDYLKEASSALEMRPVRPVRPPK